jgi:hypothetical protein
MLAISTNTHDIENVNVPKDAPCNFTSGDVVASILLSQLQKVIFTVKKLLLISNMLISRSNGDQFGNRNSQPFNALPC